MKSSSFFSPSLLPVILKTNYKTFILKRSSKAGEHLTFYYKWSSIQSQSNLYKYLQKAQIQVNKHFLAWAEGSWLSVFTFYEPVLRVEILVKSFFFVLKYAFLVVLFLTFTMKTKLLIYQRKKQKGWHMTFLFSKSGIILMHCGFNTDLTEKGN